MLESNEGSEEAKKRGRTRSKDERAHEHWRTKPAPLATREGFKADVDESRLQFRIV